MEKGKFLQLLKIFKYLQVLENQISNNTFYISLLWAPLPLLFAGNLIKIWLQY